MSSTNPAILEGTTAFVRDRFLVGDMTALANINAGVAVKVAAGSSQAVVATTAVADTLYGITLINANAGAKTTIVARGLARATSTNAMSAGDLVGPSATSGNVQSITGINYSSNATVFATLPRGICIVGTATSGSTVLVDLF